jgi:hypothetical protein
VSKIIKPLQSLPTGYTAFLFTHTPEMIIAPGLRFQDESDEPCPEHDTLDRLWKHLCFIKHTYYLQCPVPRITSTEIKVITVGVSWARPGSGVSLYYSKLWR